MQRVSSELKTILWTYVIIGLILVVIYETGLYLTLAQWLHADFFLLGNLAVNGTFCAVSLFVMELLTVCLIPAMLYLMRFSRVRNSLKESPVRQMRFWGGARLHVLGLLLLANILLYYLTMSASFGYLAIIVLLVFPFVYPTEARCHNESGA